MKKQDKNDTAREGYVSLNDILLEELKELVGEKLSCCQIEGRKNG